MKQGKAESFSRALDRAISDKKLQKKGYSAKKMAIAVGIHYYTLANLRRGNTAITDEILFAISAELPTFKKHYEEAEEQLAPPEGGREEDPQKAMFEQLLREVREIRDGLVQENQALYKKYIRLLEEKADNLKDL